MYCVAEGGIAITRHTDLSTNNDVDLSQNDGDYGPASNMVGAGDFALTGQVYVGRRDDQVQPPLLWLGYSIRC